MIDVGSKFRDYEIIAQLRVGGMAALYAGRRSGAAGFNRLVAIKVIHPHLSRDKNFVQMFVDEALISARIDHPNVVHVEELGETDGMYFLAMEYVHGASLSQLLSKLVKEGRRLKPELAVHIAARVAEGLHAAHETRDADGHMLGIVHRDVSPQNVLISSRGHVKLIDFGIAKARNRVQQETASSLKGKIGYMSPEQAYGRQIDRRTDLYALGVVLWEMLTTRRMFTAEDDFALLDLVREPNVPPPSHYNPAVPPELDAVVMKALARSPENRVQTGQEFRRLLAEAMPKALTLDVADLADLLFAMLGDSLEEERRQLAAVATSAPTGERTPIAANLPALTAERTVSSARIVDQLTVADTPPVRRSMPPPPPPPVLPKSENPPSVVLDEPLPIDAAPTVISDGAYALSSHEHSDELAPEPTAIMPGLSDEPVSAPPPPTTRLRPVTPISAETTSPAAQRPTASDTARPPARAPNAGSSAFAAPPAVAPAKKFPMAVVMGAVVLFAGIAVAAGLMVRNRQKHAADVAAAALDPVVVAPQPVANHPANKPQNVIAPQPAVIVPTPVAAVPVPAPVPVPTSAAVIVAPPVTQVVAPAEMHAHTQTAAVVHATEVPPRTGTATPTSPPTRATEDAGAHSHSHGSSHATHPGAGSKVVLPMATDFDLR